MRLFKGYTNIKDFLHRFTILKIGALHIRLHRLLSEDQTTLYHNHPFHYISIILRGGYIEKQFNPETKKTKIKTHNRLSILFRNKKIYHRIESVKPNTLTLFISYGKDKWDAINYGMPKHPNGVYKRVVNKKEKWCKYTDGIWRIGHSCIGKALKEDRPSIHQI